MLYENLKLKMMKKILAFILAVFIAIPAFSQISWGIKAGVSTNSISMDKAVQLTGQAGTYTVQALTNANYGYHGGLFVRLSLFGVYIQPEVLFATTENKYNVTSPGVANPKEVIQKLNNLSIPVMVGFKLGPIRINAGPAASLAITTPKALITDQNLTNLYNKMSFGYQAGLGFDLFKILTFDLRYEGSLRKYQTQIQNTVGGTKVSLDTRPNALLFSVGLMF
jgi:opacity protein-like surface antigen